MWEVWGPVDISETGVPVKKLYIGLTKLIYTGLGSTNSVIISHV